MTTREETHEMDPTPYLGGSVPVPDPTKLTADAVNQAKADLRRELAAQRELIMTRIDGLTEIVGIHGSQILQESKRADELMGDSWTRTQGYVQTVVNDAHDKNLLEIDRLRDVMHEKFGTVDQRFTSNDLRLDTSAQTSQKALDAALQAAAALVAQQNEANAAAAAKSETSFTKQIDQIGTIISTLEKALDARITELKERIDRGEGQVTGAASDRTERRLTTGQILAFVSVSLLSVSIIVATLVAVFK